MSFFRRTTSSTPACSAYPRQLLRSFTSDPSPELSSPSLCVLPAVSRLEACLTPRQPRGKLLSGTHDTLEDPVNICSAASPPRTRALSASVAQTRSRSILPAPGGNKSKLRRSVCASFCDSQQLLARLGLRSTEVIAICPQIIALFPNHPRFRCSALCVCLTHCGRNVSLLDKFERISNSYTCERRSVLLFGATLFSLFIIILNTGCVYLFWQDISRLGAV